MTSVVIDASAAVKLLLDEPGRGAITEVWRQPTLSFLAPTVLLAEVPAALDSAVRNARLTASQRRTIDQMWRRHRRFISLRAVDFRFAARAGAMSAILRGVDRLYLQTAREMGGAPLLSFDRRQRQAAAELGLAVMPARI